MKIFLCTLVLIWVLLGSGCGNDFSGSWYNPEGDLEMYIHNMFPGPVDFSVVGGATLRYDCLQESVRNGKTYLILQPRDERHINDHFLILEYTNSRSDLITMKSYYGSAVGFTVLGEEADFAYSVRFTR